MNNFFFKTNYIFIVISLLILQFCNVDAMTLENMNLEDTELLSNQKEKKETTLAEAENESYIKTDRWVRKKKEAFTPISLYNLVQPWVEWDDIRKELAKVRQKNGQLEKENREVKDKFSNQHDENIILRQKYLDKKRELKSLKSLNSPTKFSKKRITLFALSSSILGILIYKLLGNTINLKSE